MLSSSEKYELKKKFRHLEAEICKLDTALDSKADLVDGVVPTSQLPITQDIIDALNNANAPNGINYFTTLADLSSITPGTLINVANNYAALPAANTVPGEFYWVENAQGTSWLPGPLGGTYYPNGLYYSNGTTWIFTDVPFNATQVEVDAGLNNNKFLTPMTFENAAKWNTKVSSVTGPAVDNTDPLNPVITIPTNLTFYSTTAASTIPGYNKLVISLDDPSYNTIPVDVSTGPISGLAQPVGSLVSDAGIFAGNPGTINVNTLGEIRRVSGTGTVEFYYEIYQRDSGGIETLVATSNLTSPVTTTVYQQFQASALFNNGTWAATDRVVIKYYGNRIPGGSDPVYEFLFGGTNPVKTLFPISASLLLNVPIAIGVTGVTGGTPGSALTVGPTGLLSQLAFDSTPTNGSLNPVFSDGVYDALQLKQDNVTLTTTGTGGAATLVGSTLNIPQYQSVLTNPITGTGTAGQVAYWDGTTTQTGSNNLFWDNANGRLGIGTNAPSSQLHIKGATDASLAIAGSSAGRRALLQYFNAPAVFNISVDNIFRIQCGSIYTIIANSSGNVGINTFSPLAGTSLHVAGSTLLRGSGTTSATTALLVQNSTPTALLQVNDDGGTRISGLTSVLGANVANVGLAVYANGTGGGNFIMQGLDSSSNLRFRLTATGNFRIDGATDTGTSGDDEKFRLNYTFAPTSGTRAHNGIWLLQTINQTGGANGITRGLYVNPTLTSAADWRSVEFSNNTGWGLYGAGTANNYLGGKLGIGTTSLTYQNFVINRTITGATISTSCELLGNVQSDVTNIASGYSSAIGTQNTVFTLNSLRHVFVQQGIFGASSTVTSQSAFHVNSSLTGATNNYGFYGGINSGLGRWNLYMEGTAANYLAGNTSIGTTTSSGRLTVRGSGTTSATTALLVQNSTPTDLLQILDNGRINQTIPGAGNNTIFGTNAGASASLSGIGNTFFGGSTGQFNTTGSDNTSIGFFCLRNNQAGSGNLAVGRSALRDSTSSQNTAIGAYACLLQTTGSNNTGIGYQALNGNTTGNNNTAIGRDSLLNIIGSNNVSVGLNSGRYLADGITALTIANQSLFIGNDTRANANSETNQIVIGYQAIGNGSNTVTLGNTSITATYLRGSISVDAPTIDASAKLQIDSTTKGFLPPRMTEAEKNAISTPATGLLIYQTDATAGFYFYNGAAWKALAIIA